MKKSAAVATSLALITSFLLGAPPQAEARAGRVLKFNGVPTTMAPQIKKRFPFVFEREISLAEIDEVVRFLFKTGQFSNVEVVERELANGATETVLVATVLRQIQDIRISGNESLSESAILKMLGLARGQTFERKNLLAAAEELRRTYEGLGYHNAKVEIDFDLPNEGEVVISVAIREGAPVRMNEIVIDTQSPELNRDLGKMSRRLKGKILTEDELLEFQKRVGEYLQKNRYFTARLSAPSISYSPDRTAAKLTYVIENPWKIDFEFTGNQYFYDDTIIQALEEEKLAGVISSPAPDMADKIRRMYQNVGYANVEVTYTEKLNEKDHRLKIRFDIKEFPRVRIKAIEVTGNISRPESYYAQFIKASNADFMSKGFYNRKDVEESTKRLITELQNQGYLRARIQSQRSEFSRDKRTVEISIALDEGPLTQVRQIRLEGVDSFPKAQILELLKIKTGAALGLSELEESLQILKGFYRSEGFLEMRIKNEGEQNRIVTYNDTNTQATVELQIYEGPRVRVGSVMTQGNTFTKDYVIQRELAFKVGDILTPEKIDESIFRLQKLDHFSNVTLRTIEDGTSVAERNVIIEVSEKNPGLVLTRAGVTNERDYLTIRGAIGLSYRNLWGTGRGVSLRVDPKYSTDPNVSYVEHIATLSYLEPYVFGDRNRGRVTLVREQQLFSLPFNESAVIREANSIGFLLDRDITRNIRLSFTAYSLSNERYFRRLDYQTTKVQNIAKVGPLIEFDFRDDAFNPTKGLYTTLNFEYSDPLLGSSDDSATTIHFVKSTGSITHYQPILKRRDLTWVNQFRSGYLANLSSKPRSGVPASEAFFLGGRSTIRGFDVSNDNERVPNPLDLGSRIEDFIVTGDSYFGLIKTELWFPIYGSLGGTIFYDGGAVFVNQPNFYQPDPYRDSVGVGLRFITPVGPANFEFGYKLDRRLINVGVNGQGDNYESPWAIHISIGAL